MECTFCDIVKEGNREKIVYEDEETALFPPLEEDILAEGHLILVPKDHFRNLFDIPPEELNSVIQTARKIAGELKEKFEGINILHASGRAAQQSVNHFHLHLVPRKEDDGYNMWPESGYEEGSYEETYLKIEEILTGS